VGERITVHHVGTAIAAEVVATPFLDPQGERLHGRA
jgi:sarcosine oxidase subunit alpha